MTSVDPLLLSHALVGADPDRCLIGADDEDEPFFWELDYVPACHLLIAGQTGSGKGGTLTTVLVHQLAAGNELIIIEPKPGEFGWVDGAAARVSTPDGMLRVLQYAEEERAKRMAMRERHIDPVTGIRGARTVFDLPNPPKRIVVVIDECPQVLSPAALIKFSSNRNKGKLWLGDMTDYTSSLVATGRSEGIVVVVVAQNPTLEGMFGANQDAHPIRLNLPARIQCDRTPQSLRAMFESGYGIDDHTLDALADGDPGRVGFGKIQAKDRGTVRAGQVLWLEPHEVRPFAERYEGPEPHVFEAKPD